MKQSPHEGLFKSLMTRKENAQIFLSAVLSEGVLAHLHLESLTVENISYVDDHLNQHYSDLIFSIKLAGGGTARLRFIVFWNIKAHPITGLLYNCYVIWPCSGQI
ncbi:Rpn family recombination-promoting nuclease/putative transposase [bacterium]|nr:Rpn family recombination-promoting nuclease/putative transposase [bacterium]